MSGLYKRYEPIENSAKSIQFCADLVRAEGRHSKTNQDNLDFSRQTSRGRPGLSFLVWQPFLAQILMCQDLKCRKNIFPS